MVTSSFGFKAKVNPSLTPFITCVQWIPQFILGATPADLFGASIRGREPGGVHETLMIAKHQPCIDF